jgi:hypothetical protein
VEDIMRKSISFLLLLILMTGAYADITLSGDARVRPIMDIRDYGEYGNGTTDNYYLYRARLFVAADIGDGYFFKTTLGHNGVAYWIGSFGTGTTPNGLSNPAAGRGTVDFMELYFGYQGDNYGWQTGLIPVACTPLTDMHFYPTLMVDLPYLIFNNNAAHGFNFNYKLGGQNLDLKVLVDDNAGVKVSVDGEVVDSLSTKDQYTLDVSYPVSIAGIKVTPELLKTISDDNAAAPMTYGAEFSLPKIAGFGVSAFFGATSQTVADTLTSLEAYSGWIGRIKLVGSIGPGSLTAWYDLGQITPDVTDAISRDHSYLWLSYSYTLHKSEKGALTIAPTYRLTKQQIEGSKDYTRAKIELTTQITFK